MSSQLGDKLKKVPFIQHKINFKLTIIILVYIFISHFNIDEYYLPEDLRKRYQIWTSLGKGAAGEVRLAYEKVLCGFLCVIRVYLLPNSCRFLVRNTLLRK